MNDCRAFSSGSGSYPTEASAGKDALLKRSNPQPAGNTGAGTRSAGTSIRLVITNVLLTGPVALPADTNSSPVALNARLVVPSVRPVGHIALPTEARSHPADGASLFYAAGIAAISRWLSDSDTTGKVPKSGASRRDASKGPSRRCMLPDSPRFWHPWRDASVGRGSGGIAPSSLNHRLMAGMPPAFFRMPRASVRTAHKLCTVSATSLCALPGSGNAAFMPQPPASPKPHGSPRP